MKISTIYYCIEQCLMGFLAKWFVIKILKTLIKVYEFLYDHHHNLGFAFVEITFLHKITDPHLERC